MNTNPPFVTADQPVINIAPKLKELTPPSSFEGYYPVSPVRALLLLEPNSDFLPRDMSISPLEAHLWNLRIASRAYQQVFARDFRQLETIKANFPAYVNSVRSQ
jgi:hypothetical protein